MKHPEAVSVSGRMVRREEFGQGALGDSAWLYISSGMTCEAIIGGQPCGKPGIGTTDFDVLGDAEQKIHCSGECATLIRAVVEKDLQMQGRSTVFGINGKGRSQARSWTPNTTPNLIPS